MEEQEVAIGHLESLWRERLILEGWSDTAIASALGSYAEATWATYNRQYQRFQQFLKQQQILEEAVTPAIIADFIHQVAGNSPRPRAALTQISAMFSC